MIRFILSSIAVFLIFTGCTQSENNLQLQSKIKSLEKDIEDLKPGLGDIMSSIQTHHAKLYFAGKNENWDLAKFEYHEIEEGFEGAVKWHETIEDVPEPTSQLIKITDAGMHELESAIEKKSKDQFLLAHRSLTNACNACHSAAAHAFIVIQEPKSLTFTNQKFEK